MNSTPPLQTPPPANPHADTAALDDLVIEAAGLDEPLNPKGTPSVAQLVSSIPTKDLCVMVLTPAFAIFAPNWNVRTSEIEQLGDAYGKVIDKYFPDGFGKYDAEITALVVTSMIVMPRRGKPPRIEEKDAKPTADAQP